MFTVTKNAQAQVAEYFKDKEKQPVRLFVNEGCGGARIAMALDIKRDTDMVYRVGDVEYLVDKELLKQAQPIEVDFIETGFRVTSELELGGGCAGCGSSGSCCS